jgi:hypothetical protein
MSGNANGRATVRNTRRKGVDVTCLVTTSQAEIVVVTVNGNVFIVTLRQLLNGSIDSLEYLRVRASPWSSSLCGSLHRSSRLKGVSGGRKPLHPTALQLERGDSEPSRAHLPWKCPRTGQLGTPTEKA